MLYCEKAQIQTFYSFLRYSVVTRRGTPLFKYHYILDNYEANFIRTKKRKRLEAEI